MVNQHEYLISCYHCAQPFDAQTSQWCGCSQLTPTKVCPYCYRCFCDAPEAYLKSFWANAPEALRRAQQARERPRGKFVDALLRSGLISTAQLMEAWEIQRKTNQRIADILVEKGHLSEETMTSFLAQLYELLEMEIEEAKLDPALVYRCGYELCQEHGVLPLEHQVTAEGQMIVLGMKEPLTLETLDKISSALGSRLHPVLCTPSALDRALETIKPQVEALEERKALDQEARFHFDQCLKAALARNAEAIYLAPAADGKEFLVHLRVGSQKLLAKLLPAELGPPIVRLIKEYAKLEMIRRFEYQRGTVRLKIQDRPYVLTVETEIENGIEGLVVSIKEVEPESENGFAN